MAKNKYLNRQLPANASAGHKKLAEILDTVLPYYTIVYEFPCSKAAERKGLSPEEYGVAKQTFDFYVIELEMAIEYNGKQHYVDGKWSPHSEARDARKVFFCQDAGIDLISIPYTMSLDFINVKERLGI